eukprot:TRINITY_DN6465_c0_g1_i1.p1 TRINITY_DN6465_c0_g1~~TRINITY_DN6465_c0_g1_i1.p1  ORF type:complete len:275 (-),score=53.46 TRINITY_DN6465_c0_g1_i1:37-861(-)
MVRGERGLEPFVPGGKRLKGVAVEKAIVTGSQAYWLGKVNRRPEEASHEWHVYLRAANNEDMSYFIKKVVFHLHETFNPPRREFEEPPYEVTESGWGEFDIGIQIFFVDPVEKPVYLLHSLKLFSHDGTPVSTQVPVVQELYDEIVFNDPTEGFYKRLVAGTTRRVRTDLQEHFKKFDETGELARVQEARAKIQQEISAMRARAVANDQELEQLRREVQILENEQKKGNKSAAKVEQHIDLTQPITPAIPMADVIKTEPASTPRASTADDPMQL